MVVSIFSRTNSQTEDKKIPEFPGPSNLGPSSATFQTLKYSGDDFQWIFKTILRYNYLLFQAKIKKPPKILKSEVFSLGPQTFIKVSQILIVIILFSNAKIILPCPAVKTAIEFFSRLRFPKNKPWSGDNSTNTRWEPKSWYSPSGASSKSSYKNAWERPELL